MSDKPVPGYSFKPPMHAKCSTGQVLLCDGDKTVGFLSAELQQFTVSSIAGYYN